MGNKFEIVKHIFLDVQAAVSGGIMGVGVMHPGNPDIETIAIGLAIGAYGAITVKKINEMQANMLPMDATDIVRQKDEK